MPNDPVEISFALNGQAHTLRVDPKRSALAVLRELGADTLNAGCSPQGICGCCAAVVNGKPRLTCTLRAKSLNKKTIETQGSFSAAERDAVTQAFAASGATQCGYCTPGIATQALSLLRRVPEPDDVVIDKALNQHICRCTGWTKIREAIKLTGQLLRDADTPLPAGRSTPATRAAVLGDRTRIDAMIRPGMVHIAPRFAPHARCAVTAIVVPDGVKAITAADIPGANDIGAGQPLLVGVGSRTRCVADVVALAVGATLEEARASAAKIVVEAEALDLDLHPEAGEILDEHHITLGTAPDRAAVAHTVSADVSVAPTAPAFLEPDAALAVPMSTGLRLYSPTADAFAERDRLAGVLAQPADTIHIEAVACGGAFGGRGGSQVAGWAALAAHTLGRPARVVLPHEDATRLHAGRPAATLTLVAQADAEGRLLSLDGELLTDGGGYGATAAAMTQRAAALLAGPYAVRHLDVRARCAQTHNPPAGATRGLGGVPGTVALERCLDQLAAATGKDPVAIRRDNLADARHRAVLDAVAGRYADARAQGDAAGLACAAQGLGRGGDEVARVALSVQATGEVRLYTSYLESGQGFEPAAAHAASEASGLGADQFVVIAGTDGGVDSGTPLAGSERWLGLAAVRQAAGRLKAALASAGTLGALVGQRFEGEARSAQEAGSFAALGFAAEVVVLDERGAVAEVIAAVDVGDDTDPVGTSGQIEGAIHMGLGMALGEHRFVQPDGQPETQYRKLGVLKARYSPPVVAQMVASAGSRPVDDVALLAVIPAVAAALRARGDEPGESIPMLTSAAAKAAGIKPVKVKAR